MVWTTSEAAASVPILLPRSYRSFSSSDYYRHSANRYPKTDPSYCSYDSMRTSPFGSIARRPSWHATQPQDQTNSGVTGQRRRVSTACARCRKRKIRCSGESRGGRACQSCRGAGADADCSFFRVGSKEIPYHNIDWHEVGSRSRTLSLPTRSPEDLRMSSADAVMYPLEPRQRQSFAQFDSQDYYDHSQSFNEDMPLSIDSYSLVHPEAFSDTVPRTLAIDDCYPLYGTSAPGLDASAVLFGSSSELHVPNINLPGSSAFKMNSLSTSLLPMPATSTRHVPTSYYSQLVSQSTGSHDTPYHDSDARSIVSVEHEHWKIAPSLTRPVPHVNTQFYHTNQIMAENRYPATPAASPVAPHSSQSDILLLGKSANTGMHTSNMYRTGAQVYSSPPSNVTNSTSEQSAYQIVENHSAEKNQESLDLEHDVTADFSQTSIHRGDTTEYNGSLSRQPVENGYSSGNHYERYNVLGENLYSFNHQTRQRESASRFERQPSSSQPNDVASVRHS